MAPTPEVTVEYEESHGGRWFAHVADGDLRETLIGHDHGDAVRQAESWRAWRERLAREADGATPA